MSIVHHEYNGGDLRVVALGIFFIKSNKKTTWIYQCHKKITQMHEILQFLYTNKVKEKNRLIKKKVKIERLGGVWWVFLNNNF